MTQTLSGHWHYPTKVIFGAGVIKQLPEVCRQLGMTKPLLITDEGLARAEITTNTIAITQKAGLEAGLFTQVKGNPTGQNVEDGVKAYHDGGYDGVIAFGGGSGLDAAKAIALMVGQDRPLWDFEDVGDNWTRVNADAMAPVVAIPTTSGTGSEVGRASVITNEATHEKKIIFHPKMLPAIVLADPDLTIGLPKALTAATGLDAFIHCFEAYCAPGYHPMADGIALEGMRLVKTYLPRAYSEGTDIEARSHMLVASAMGATAFQKGLGGTHALAHPLGGLYDKHHGLLNAVLLPYVMVRNRAAIEGRVNMLARILDISSDSFSSFEAFLNWVMIFREELGIPHTLTALNIPLDRAAEIGQMAYADPSAGGNPVALTAEDYAGLFENAVTGNFYKA